MKPSVLDLMAMPFMHCPFDHIDEVDAINSWCRDNLSGGWTMSSHYPGYGATPPTWYFESREDHVAFLLRWGR